MSADALFQLVGPVAMLGWLLLAILPGWRYTQRLVVSVAVTLLSVAYLVIAAIHLPGAEGGFGSLADVALLFRNDWLLLVGWIHYLAFDLFVGSWEVRDARRLRIPHLAVVPCLLLTFLLGPVGWLCYLILRIVLRRRFNPEETDAAD